MRDREVSCVMLKTKSKVGTVLFLADSYFIPQWRKIQPKLGNIPLFRSTYGPRFYNTKMAKT